MGREPFRFEILRTQPAGDARRGRITTAHGTVETPAFMPVATVGSVKGVLPGQLREIGAELLLGNAYHLSLRPGVDVIRAQGGLARFMGWDGPILTDSGGFQVFSLGSNVRLGEHGVRIRSHLDGSFHDLTPEKVISIQEGLGVDVMMPLDDCPPYPADPERLSESVDRTTRWLERSIGARRGHGALFGIVQGGVDRDLRRRSAGEIGALRLPGTAVGGLSVGEPKEVLFETAAFTAPLLPPDGPRYVMGTGTPEDLVHLVAMGYDLFDCVLPTRNARNGTLFSSRGKINIRNARFASDGAPPDPECGCPVCRRFSRAYLRHLAVAGEILSSVLSSIHNLAFYLGLMRGMREALEHDRFPEYTSRTLRNLSASEDR